MHHSLLKKDLDQWCFPERLEDLIHDHPVDFTIPLTDRVNSKELEVHRHQRPQENPLRCRNLKAWGGMRPGVFDINKARRGGLKVVTPPGFEPGFSP